MRKNIGKLVRYFYTRAHKRANERTRFTDAKLIIRTTDYMEQVTNPGSPFLGSAKTLVEIF